MRVVFMGTPQLSASIMDALAQAHDVVGVYTRPDAVRGRGKKLVASPVKSRALELELPVYTPESLYDESVQSQLKALQPDVICVAAYGALLPKEVLEIPVYGCLNVHTSLLPRWRGAAPIQRAILENDEITGVSIMKMEEGLDTGPYCLQTTVPCAGQTLSQLEAELAKSGAHDLLKALDGLAGKTLTWVDQGDEGVCYAEKIMKTELLLDPSDTALQNVARVRAASDAHPSRASVCGKSLTILGALPVTDDLALDITRNLEPGRALFSAKRLLARASDAPFEITKVKPDGKKEMDAKAFAAGLQGIKGKSFVWEKL